MNPSLMAAARFRSYPKIFPLVWWYDPSDLSTLFQDAAGTVPVTAVGQSVALMLDKSGNGKHQVQATALNRPLLQITSGGSYYLAADGVNTWMSSAATIDLTSTNKLSVCAAFDNTATATSQIVMEFGPSIGLVTGSFLVANPASGTAVSSAGFTAKGTLLPPAISRIVLSRPIVLIGQADLSAPLRDIIANGSHAADISSMGTGNFSTQYLYLFKRGGTSFPMNGKFFGSFATGRMLSVTESAQSARWMRGKSL